MNKTCNKTGTYCSRTIADQLKSKSIRPRKGHELIPPAIYHLRDVESSEKSYGDQAAEAIGINTDHFKQLPVDRVVE